MLEDVSLAVSFFAEKVGECPRQRLECRNESLSSCKTDFNCKAHFKCCQFACGRKCMDPYEEPCMLPSDKGNCQDILTRWYFDSQKHQCRAFLYSGCRGNANNFLTKTDCRNACMFVEKKGQCPLFPFQMRMECPASCKNDMDCPEKEKCCESRCGFICARVWLVSCFRPGQQPGRILSLIDKRDPFIFSVTFGVRSTHSVTQLSSCHFTGCSSHCIHGIFGFVPAMHGVPVQRVPGLTGHHGLGLSHEHRAMPDTQPRLSSPLASQTTASLHSCRLCTRIWGEIPPHCTPRPPPWGGASSAPLTHPWTRCTLCQRPLATGSGLLLLSSSPYCPCNLPAVPRCISVLNNCLKLIRFFYIFQTY